MVSLSSGLAGESSILWRTYQGIERLKSVFGLKVKVMPHALKGRQFVHNHPELRAADLNAAIKDDDINGIISCIGGDDAIRILPYVDLEAIRKHPKIFIGYSDSTTVHMMFYCMGIVSFYGPALLTDFAENIAMDTYTINNIEKSLFCSEPIGNISASEYIRPYGLSWNIENKNIARPVVEQHGYELLQGNGVVQGHLVGGNIETLVSLQATSLFLNKYESDGAILFIETSEDMPAPRELQNQLEILIQYDIITNCNGLIFGKPFNNVYYEAYKAIILKVMKRHQLQDKPILYNTSFGHNEPKFIIPYGVKGEINSDTQQFRILENGVVSI
nr:S66 peptidase family protein [Staphylococcus caeli]